MDLTKKPKPIEYHIRIAGMIDALKIGESYQQRVNQFLANLFDLTGTGIGNSPLRFNEETSRLETTAISSMSVIWVSFCLTIDAERSGNTLDEAVKMFCQAIFDPRAESCLKALTSFGILGLSPLTSQPMRHWTHECFRNYGMNGPILLKMIHRDFDNYLPQWALALSFMVVVGSSFRVFCNNIPASPPVTDGDAVSLGSSILEKYAQLVKPDSRNSEQVCKRELAKNLYELVTKLETMTDLEGTNLLHDRDRLCAHNDLCNALYYAEETGKVGGCRG